jgi:hypothetical protein
MIEMVQPTDSVAVIDDDRGAAEAMSEIVRDAGFDPFVVTGRRFEMVSDLVSHVQLNARAAVCDHRLRPRQLAAFDGAEAAVELMNVRIPSVLVTQYVDTDSHVSIRRWRRDIPVLLSRDDADSDRIKQGLDDCAREMMGEYLPGRRPWRTLIQVDGIDQESGEQVVEARVPAWNPLKVVRFPSSLLPHGLRAAIAPGTYLFAEVNIGAETEEELYFSEFEPAPDPVVEDSLG